jgi:hypothetical protein
MLQLILLLSYLLLLKKMQKSTGHFIGSIVADKRFHCVRETKLGTTNAWSIVLNGPVYVLIPLPYRAVYECHRSTAAQLEHAGFIP